ncbi:hypothetical protein CAEBREN_23353 [Caenorhabditis brenneri]|uniref:Uncharacterized protein n=1 Tax=Caenorhabditis brenneri TaxID=135651 RepID=G0N1Q4_CAEBE|nr:hypothetical protein CAEBREN_23353 [Caenorhabditis brenneri]
MALSIRTIIFFAMCSSVSSSTTYNSVEPPPLYRTDIGTDDEIFELVKASCPSMSMMCPFAEFAVKPYNHEWIKEKVLAARAVEVYKLGAVRRPDEKDYFRAFFCCTHGPCMKECGLHQKEEKQIVKDFPENVDAIFALGIQELEPFEKYVRKYVARIGDLGKRWRRPYEFPAEIEEYFDFITKHEMILTKLLEDQELRNKAFNNE